MINTNSFQTIKESAEGLYKEKGSKFLAFALPVQTIEEVKQHINRYQQQYYDARHVCYAYMLGAERKDFRSYDDGEPSGTAGRPILGQINAFELTDILVVVIRYFGGILLGTGGLITAYKEATFDVLNNAIIIKKELQMGYKLEFGYERMSWVMKTIKEWDATIDEMKMDYTCRYKIHIDKDKASSFLKQIQVNYDIKIEEIEML